VRRDVCRDALLHLPFRLPDAVSQPAPGPPNGPGAAAAVAVSPVSGGTVSGQMARWLADPRLLARAAPRPPSALGGPAWRPGSLAQGHPGAAVLCAALDQAFPEAGWDRVGHQHLAAAAAAVSPHDSSLFSGMAGLGFAAVLLAAGRPRYERVLRQVDAAIEAPLDRTLQRLTAPGCRVSEFDLVSGLTGTGIYLLARHQAQLGQPGAAPEEPHRAMTRAMLDRLLGGLTGLLAAPGEPRRWHTPAHLTTGPLRESFPRGLHNCGLAHGAPGPLALLSLALLAGLRVPGAADAIHATASWLAANRTGTAREPDWQDGVALDAPAPPAPPAAPGEGQDPGRAAWCYGTPGVARSLWLAGRAVAERHWQELAARAIRAVAGRPLTAWGLSGPGFCHGEAGLLQVLRRFAADLGDPAIGDAAGRLTARLVSRFDPGAPFGVRVADPDGVLTDQPGLLDGAAGIALALHALPEARPASLPAAPPWDRAFLLA
jgi:lantibiotic biosynthesis protein